MLSKIQHEVEVIYFSEVHLKNIILDARKTGFNLIFGAKNRS